MKHKRLLLMVLSVFTIGTVHAGTGNGHEWVDLGLSVKWATCNVGAASPTEIGGKYVFGSLKEKETINTISDDLGDYIVLWKEIAASEFDVAHEQWGTHWRMPTVKEVSELMDKCQISIVTIGGVDGVKFVGPNGNSIFLPVTSGTKAFYWSDSVYDSITDIDAAYALEFDTSTEKIKIYGRNMVKWSCVRPVYDTTVQ
jgi:hypothetical protein